MDELKELKKRLENTSKFQYFGTFAQKEVFEVIDEIRNAREHGEIGNN